MVLLHLSRDFLSYLFEKSSRNSQESFLEVSVAVFSIISLSILSRNSSKKRKNNFLTEFPKEFQKIFWDFEDFINISEDIFAGTKRATSKKIFLRDFFQESLKFLKKSLGQILGRISKAISVGFVVLENFWNTKKKIPCWNSTRNFKV